MYRGSVESTVATGSSFTARHYFSQCDPSHIEHIRWKRSKCSQAVELAFCYEKRELQPGCTTNNAARLYKRKCTQTVVLPFMYKRRELHYSLAVQAEVQPGCSVELPFYKKRELQFPSLAVKGQFYGLAALPLVQPGCSCMHSLILKGYCSSAAWLHFLSFVQPGCTSSCTARL